jgi:hypothetical protein
MGSELEDAPSTGFAGPPPPFRLRSTVEERVPRGAHQSGAKR